MAYKKTVIFIFIMKLMPQAAVQPEVAAYSLYCRPCTLRVQRQTQDTAVSSSSNPTRFIAYPHRLHVSSTLPCSAHCGSAEQQYIDCQSLGGCSCTATHSIGSSRDLLLLPRLWQLMHRRYPSRRNQAEPNGCQCHSHVLGFSLRWESSRQAWVQ